MLPCTLVLYSSLPCLKREYFRGVLWGWKCEWSQVKEYWVGRTYLQQSNNSEQHQLKNQWEVHAGRIFRIQSIWLIVFLCCYFSLLCSYSFKTINGLEGRNKEPMPVKTQPYIFEKCHCISPLWLSLTWIFCHLRCLLLRTAGECNFCLTVSVALKMQNDNSGSFLAHSCLKQKYVDWLGNQLNSPWRAHQGTAYVYIQTVNGNTQVITVAHLHFKS